MSVRVFVMLLWSVCLVAVFGLSQPAIAGVTGPLTYDQIRGTGLANKCPDVTGVSRGRGVIPVAVGSSVQISDLCLEPTSFLIKEEATNKRRKAEFVTGKLLTRATSSLDFVKATVTANEDGSLSLMEQEGLDYQPITVQMPGGERVALLFTIKGYRAQSQPGLNGITTSTDFEGTTDVPTYRGANFIDPKGRGLAIGYDAAEALPAKRDNYKESSKNDATFKGKMSLQIQKLNSETGEIAGTFECEQLSDTDLGTLEPKEVIIRGVFFGRVA
ncbi:MAG: Photosystem II manganese-stabilizing protein (PsbO) [Oscillatoriales cyanobacterium SM2_2_1]|nr:Photosystem II manganese-stabilizing protein (PsbO) [Oscillatoriales cyanobacterium SM2_2_1]